jgi:MFS family permease
LTGELSAAQSDPAAEPSPVPGVSRNVFVFGVVSFFADVASEMLYPLIPIFLTTTLGAPVAVLGAIEGVAEGTASSLKVVSGWYADRVHRRKPLVAAGYALSALGKLILAVAFVWPQVLLARFVDRFGKGVRTSPRDALIADSTDPTRFGRAYGFHRATDTAGAVVGPLLGLGLLALFGEDHLRPIFALAVVPGLASVVLIALVRERARAPARPATQVRVDLSGAGVTFWLFLGISAIFALGNSSDAFLILRAKDLGLSLTAVILAYVLYNVVYSLLAMPSGIASDRLGRRMVMVGGFLVYGLVYLGFAAVGSGAAVWPLFAVYGVYIALTEGVARAFVADLAPVDRRATFLGVYHTSIGLMAVASSVLAGILWQAVAPGAPFLLGASTAFLSAALLLALPMGAGVRLALEK